MLREPRKDKNKMSKSHVRSSYQEKETAARLGGKTTIGSGNKLEKGDVRVRKIVRLELKCTQKKSFSLTEVMLEKIQAAALMSGEIPAMGIEFIDDKTGKVKHKWVLMPEYALDDYVVENRIALEESSNGKYIYKRDDVL